MVNIVDKKPSPLRFSVKEFSFILLLLLSLVLLGFNSGSFVVNIRQVGFSVLSSVEREVSLAGKQVVKFFTSVQELSRLQKDYDVLVKRLENYERLQRSNTQIRRENEALKEQLNFSSSLIQRAYPAKIIARSIDNLYPLLTIDKGAAHGIRKNMMVEAYQNGNNGLVGKIIQLGKWTAIVMPIYSTNCIISVRLQNTRDLGLVYGMGSEEEPLVLRYIRKRAASDLHYGDLIVTSGENNNYVKDIVIGSISKITVLDYDSSLEINVKPIIDFQKLENVVVVSLTELNPDKEEKEADKENSSKVSK